MMRINGLLTLGLMLAALPGCVRIPPPMAIAGPAGAASPGSPMFGGTPARNMVNTIDKNIPTTWSAEEGKKKNVKWTVEMGSRSFGGPAIADGVIYMGTNNAHPRDKKIEAKDKAILMAFQASDGKYLWQIVHDIPDDENFGEGRGEGLCSTPVVEGKRLYYVTPGAELVCANTSGKVEWTYDMMKQLKVMPFHLANCSPLIVGDNVMLVTSHGRDKAGDLSKAPSFIAVNKNTGKLVWQSSLPGEGIIEGQWSNPTVATVNGKPQVIFPGGDCVLYSLEPATGKLIWKCDCFPTRKGTPAKEHIYFVSTPAVVGDRLYVGLGVGPELGTNPKVGYFLCLDVTKQGDVSFKSYDAKVPVNKGSALVWAFGGYVDPPPALGKGRKTYFGVTISTAAVHDGLVYIAEEAGYLQCLDAKTGARYWEHDFKTGLWSSAYYVDGKVYIGTDDAEVIVFAAGKEKKVLATNNMEEAVKATPVAVNGVLYINTLSKLYAIAEGK